MGEVPSGPTAPFCRVYIHVLVPCLHSRPEINRHTHCVVFLGDFRKRGGCSHGQKPCQRMLSGGPEDGEEVSREEWGAACGHPPSGPQLLDRVGLGLGRGRGGWVMPLQALWLPWSEGTPGTGSPPRGRCPQIGFGSQRPPTAEVGYPRDHSFPRLLTRAGCPGEEACGHLLFRSDPSPKCGLTHQLRCHTPRQPQNSLQSWPCVSGVLMC